MVCPTINICQKILQASLVELENKTKENAQLKKDKDEIIGERNQLQKDRDEWKNLYLDERKASALLAASNLKYQDAIAGFQGQAKLDENMINAQKRQIRRLKVEKYVYSFGGFGGGFVAGYFYGKNQNRVNSFLTQSQQFQSSGLKFTF